MHHAPAAACGCFDRPPVGEVVPAKQRRARFLGQIQNEKLAMPKRTVQIDEQAGNGRVEERRAGCAGEVSREVERSRIVAPMRFEESA